MLNHAVKSGVIISVISIVFTLLIYIVDPTLMVKWWLGISILVISLSLVAYFGIQYRGEIGGFMPFKDGFIYSYVTFAIAGLIGTLFSILLYQVIDPDLPELLVEAALEQTEEMMRNFGTPESAMDEAMAEAEKSTRDSFSLFGQLRAYGIGLIIYLVFSLITGAIIKRKEPELV